MENKVSWHSDAVDIFNAILFKERCPDDYIKEQGEAIYDQVKKLGNNCSDEDLKKILTDYVHDMMASGFNNGFWGAINYFVDHNIFPDQFDGWGVSIDKVPTKEEFFKFTYFESLFANIFEECKERSLKTEDNLRFWLTHFLTGHIDNFPWLQPTGREWYMKVLDTFIEDCKRCYYQKGIADAFSLFEDVGDDVKRLDAYFGANEKYFIPNTPSYRTVTVRKESIPK